ncbi:MAG TPA: helix-turn-helix domain-containing protein [Anaerolineales bacterium]|nr:helix-turn-helix domain-containing protein [Anaerolineales bacterium]
MPRKEPLAGQRNKLCWEYVEEGRSHPTVQDPVNVGGNLRRLREERGITIRELAEQSGLAVNTLSLIENGKTSPSVSTLQQLAAALVTPITAFFEAPAAPQSIAFVRKDHRPRAAIELGMLEDLSGGTAVHAVEPFVVTLDPNASSGNREIVHTGYEFVYCLEGRILYTIDHFNYLLEPGDSLLFEAHLPHCWQNMSPDPSRSIMVLYPTDERDQPSVRHFLGE